jgi:hypothetical protein
MRYLLIGSGVEKQKGLGLSHSVDIFIFLTGAVNGDLHSDDATINVLAVLNARHFPLDRMRYLLIGSGVEKQKGRTRGRIVSIRVLPFCFSTPEPINKYLIRSSGKWRAFKPE